MPAPVHGTFLDRSLDELDGNRQAAWLLLEAACEEPGPVSEVAAHAYEDWWAVYRLWFDTWEVAWRSHQPHHRHPPQGARDWA